MIDVLRSGFLMTHFDPTNPHNFVAPPKANGPKTPRAIPIGEGFGCERFHLYLCTYDGVVLDHINGFLDVDALHARLLDFRRIAAKWPGKRRLAASSLNDSRVVVAEWLAESTGLSMQTIVSDPRLCRDITAVLLGLHEPNVRYLASQQPSTQGTAQQRGPIE